MLSKHLPPRRRSKNALHYVGLLLGEANSFDFHCEAQVPGLQVESARTGEVRNPQNSRFACDIGHLRQAKALACEDGQRSGWPGGALDAAIYTPQIPIELIEPFPSPYPTFMPSVAPPAAAAAPAALIHRTGQPIYLGVQSNKDV